MNHKRKDQSADCIWGKPRPCYTNGYNTMNYVHTVLLVLQVMGVSSPYPLNLVATSPTSPEQRQKPPTNSLSKS